MQPFSKKQNFIFIFIFLFFSNTEVFAISKIYHIKTLVDNPKNLLKINYTKKNQIIFVKPNDRIMVKVGQKEYRGKLLSINQDYEDFIILENNKKPEKIYLKEISYAKKVGLKNTLHSIWNGFKVAFGLFLGLLGLGYAMVFLILGVFAFRMSLSAVAFSTIFFIAVAVGGYYLMMNGIDVLKNKPIHKENFTIEIIQK